MSKARLNRLASAIERLKAQQVGQAKSRFAGEALPPTARGGQTFYELEAAEWLRVGDMLLGFGGTSAWTSAQMNGFGLDPDHDAAVAAELVGLGFVRDDGNPKAWTLPTQEAERQFLVDWLATADAEGREVSDRASIERWIKSLAGGVSAPTTPPPAAAPPPPASAPVKNQDDLIAQRARKQVDDPGMDAWRQATHLDTPRRDDAELDDAIIRRQQKQRRGRTN